MPRASSMPQTTIYVSPRSMGAFDTPPPAVVTAELARLFAGYPALAGISVRVERGRAIALLGPNGAGKTTLLRILATALTPSFGRAEVDGLDVVTQSPPRQAADRLPLARDRPLRRLDGTGEPGLRRDDARPRAGRAHEARGDRAGRGGPGCRRRPAGAYLLRRHAPTPGAGTPDPFGAEPDPAR